MSAKTKEANQLVLSQLINERLLEYNLGIKRVLKINAQEIYC